eukprot:2211672-Amphidinium_carterae.1
MENVWAGGEVSCCTFSLQHANGPKSLTPHVTDQKESDARFISFVPVLRPIRMWVVAEVHVLIVDLWTRHGRKELEQSRICLQGSHFDRN